MDVREYWRDVWNHAALSDNMFVQIGFSSYSPLEYFLMMKDLSGALELNKEDVLLDAGAGPCWSSMYLSAMVNKITAFDYAENNIKFASEKVCKFHNIKVLQEDLLNMGKIERNSYSKVLVNSTLQYLQNTDQIRCAMTNIYHSMMVGGVALFSRNPDIERKEAHIRSYERLDWNNDRKQKSLENEEMRLWMSYDELEKMSREIGFSECRKKEIDPQLWQSTHMFDMVVKK